MLENRERIHKIEGIVSEIGEIAVPGDAKARMRNIGKSSSTDSDHFIGNVHSMDFSAILAQVAHQASNAAADFKESAGARVAVSGSHRTSRRIARLHPGRRR